MDDGASLYIVGPTSVEVLSEALELLQLPAEVGLDVWADGDAVYVFGDDPSLSGGIARAIAVVTEADSQLVEGTLANTPESTEGAAQATVTIHQMNGEGDTFAAHSVTLTYETPVDDPAGVLDLEMLGLLEIDDDLRQLVETETS